MGFMTYEKGRFKYLRAQTGGRTRSLAVLKNAMPAQLLRQAMEIYFPGWPPGN